LAGAYDFPGQSACIFLAALFQACSAFVENNASDLGSSRRDVARRKNDLQHRKIGKSLKELRANLALVGGPFTCLSFSVTAISQMTIKFCANRECSIYGQVVYTPSTRCTCCRWDLRPSRNKSEERIAQQSPVPRAKNMRTRSLPAV
jgi:hypothetical protein